MSVAAGFWEPAGQGWQQLAELGIALVLAGCIGLERELRGKAAGIRTHTIIGFAAALIVLVSKYGFADVLGAHATVDPSRVAAQIVSGIGFIGGGIIFVRQDVVRGLTTAASVWLTTAVGMAAGAGLPVLAVVTTAGYFLIVYALTALVRWLPGSTHRRRHLHISYVDGRGVLRRVLEICTQEAWVVTKLSSHGRAEGAVDRAQPERGLVAVSLVLTGRATPQRLLGRLSELDGVVDVSWDQFVEEDE